MLANSPRVESAETEAQSRRQPSAPAVKPDASPERTAALVIARLTDDIHSVAADRRVLGYIHRVGAVYVALSGDSLDRAVEVGQSLGFQQALDRVRASAS